VQKFYSGESSRKKKFVSQTLCLCLRSTTYFFDVFHARLTQLHQRMILLL